jgi:glycosidase
LDGVFNHTGDDSVYFNKYGNYASVGAYQSKQSPYFSWYSFTEFPDKYESWWGIDVLPEVRETSKSYQSFIFGENGVLKTWLRSGIGGYRLDVADELPDFFLKKLRKSVKEENPDAIVIGEVWEDASDKIAYSARREYLQGFELDSVMNYPLKDGIIGFIQTENAHCLQRAVRLLVDHYPKQTLDCLMNILGTHDTARILTVLGGKYCKNKDEMASKDAYLDEKSKEIAIQKLKTAAVLQFTLPGVPCIYYGDENGMEGHIDPFCRQCFDWTNIHTDLLAFYQKLGKIRQEHTDVFSDGELQEIWIESGLYLFKRTKNGKSIYIYVNHCAQNYLWETDGTFQNLYNESETFTNRKSIQAYSFGIFLKQE